MKLPSWFPRGKTILILLLLAGYMGSCLTVEDTAPPLAPIGPSPEAIRTAAAKQDTATQTIDKEATKIEEKTKEAASKQSARTIKQANAGLKENIEVLEEEADAKEEIYKKYEELQTTHNKLVEKHNAVVKELKEVKAGKMKMLLNIVIIIGAVLTGLGIFLMIKSGFTLWYAPFIGLSISAAGVATRWLTNNPVLIVASIAGAALVFVLVKVFLGHDEALEESVSLVEHLKSRVKALIGYAEDEDYDKEDMEAELQSIIDDTFGTDTSSGMAGASQSNSIRDIITKKRKKLHGKWKSLRS